MKGWVALLCKEVNYYIKVAMKRRKIIPYNPKLKELARKLRNDSTYTEILLWDYLKGKRMRGYDFDRQKPIDNYIVDFYSKDLFLAIEIDGESHYGKEKRDAKRDKRLNELDVTVLRFDESDIRYKLDKVIETIEKWIDENAKK
jgi:very-short-patch-repair endonuclease